MLGAGALHTCALLDTGALRCWGDNSYGQTGRGVAEVIGDNETPASAGDVNVGGSVVSSQRAAFTPAPYSTPARCVAGDGARTASSAMAIPTTSRQRR